MTRTRVASLTGGAIAALVAFLLFAGWEPDYAGIPVPSASSLARELEQLRTRLDIPETIRIGEDYEGRSFSLGTQLADGCSHTIVSIRVSRRNAEMKLVRGMWLTLSGLTALLRAVTGATR